MGGGANNGVSDSIHLVHKQGHSQWKLDHFFSTSTCQLHFCLVYIFSSLYFSACLKYIPFFHLAWPVDHSLSVDVRWDAL